MKLDEIQDIEVLRDELKKVMVKCTENFQKEGLEFIKDEYYHFEEDSGDITIFLKIFPKENEKCFTSLEYKEEYKHFEFPKEGD